MKENRFVCGICGQISQGKRIEIEENNIKKFVCKYCYIELEYI